MLGTNQKNIPENALRVMVVDDSAVIRGLITRMLEESGDIAVVASMPNGEQALKALEKHDIDVIVLDIEMPVMDGLTALPKLLEMKPDVKIIMASTLTVKNAEVSLRAMQAGASDYVPKPTSSKEISGGLDFKRELVEKVRALGRARKGGAASAAAPAAGGSPAAIEKKGLFPGKKVTLRAPGKFTPAILAIGSSTGGPQALFAVLKGLKGLGVPIVITQHMPATFTAILAEHITRASTIPCEEGKDGDALQAGRIYLAPGGKHMLLEKKGAQVVVKLDDGPPENFCKPAVDPMLRSIAEIYGPRVLTCILTGMGNDGAKGGKVIVDAGGTVIAQDEETSTVWGMPGAAAHAGICSTILPLNDIAPHIMNVVKQGSK